MLAISIASQIWNDYQMSSGKFFDLRIKHLAVHHEAMNQQYGASSAPPNIKIGYCTQVFKKKLKLRNLNHILRHKKKPDENARLFEKLQ